MLYNICCVIYKDDATFKDIRTTFKTVYEYKHFNATSILQETDKLKKDYEMYSKNLEKIT